jgi:hypothetical protein
VRGDRDVEALIVDTEAIQADVEASPAHALGGLLAGVGFPAEVPDVLPVELADQVTLMRHDRLPWDAAPPTAVLASASYPKLVVSGGGRGRWEHVANVLAVAISAERLILPGGGHNVHRLGAPVNDALETFLASATPEELR